MRGLSIEKVGDCPVVAGVILILMHKLLSAARATPHDRKLASQKLHRQVQEAIYWYWLTGCMYAIALITSFWLICPISLPS